MAPEGGGLWSAVAAAAADAAASNNASKNSRLVVMPVLQQPMAEEDWRPDHCQVCGDFCGRPRSKYLLVPVASDVGCETEWYRGCARCFNAVFHPQLKPLPPPSPAMLMPAVEQLRQLLHVPRPPLLEGHCDCCGESRGRVGFPWRLAPAPAAPCITCHEHCASCECPGGEFFAAVRRFQLGTTAVGFHAFPASLALAEQACAEQARAYAAVDDAFTVLETSHALSATSVATLRSAWAGGDGALKLDDVMAALAGPLYEADLVAFGTPAVSWLPQPPPVKTVDDLVVATETLRLVRGIATQRHTRLEAAATHFDRAAALVRTLARAPATIVDPARPAGAFCAWLLQLWRGQTYVADQTWFFDELAAVLASTAGTLREGTIEVANGVEVARLSCDGLRQPRRRSRRRVLRGAVHSGPPQAPHA